jgi:peptidoglycan/xylan/chitin deacetylase (PgdA/CDA1 family)
MEEYTAMSSASDASGADGVNSPQLRSFFKKGRRCPALLYHHVGPRKSASLPELTLSPEQFDRQIQHLVRWGYLGITVSEWQNGYFNSDTRARPILLTFDDAYEDTARFALPVLVRHGFHATVYVVTRRIGRFNDWVKCIESAYLPLMSAEQIQYWARQGIEFGAHTRSHPNLTTLSPGDLFDEVVGSRDDLAALLGKPIHSFAYPFGAYNEPVCDLVRKHFSNAFTVREGMNLRDRDPYLLSRASVCPSASMLQYAVNVRWGGGTKWWRDLRGRVALRTRLRKAIQLPY